MSENNETPQLASAGNAGRLPAVERAGQLVEALPAGVTLPEYIAVFRRRKWIMLAAFLGVFSLVCLYTAVTPRVYEATATLLVSDAGRNSGSGAGGQFGLPSMMQEMAAPNLETHVALIQGESTARETAKWLRVHGADYLAAGKSDWHLRAQVVPKTQLITLRARAYDRREAAKIANAAAQAYTEMNRRWAQGSSESAGRFLSEQVVMAKASLEEAEKALRAFKESTNTIAEDAAAANLLTRKAMLRTDIDKSSADLAQAQKQLAQVRAQLAQQNRSITAMQVRDNTVVQQLRERLADLEGQRLAALARYTQDMPGPLAHVEEQIAIVKQQLDAGIRDIVRAGGGDLAMQQTLTGQLVQGEVVVVSLQARAARLRTELAATEAELGKVPAKQIALGRLRRQVEVSQSIYSDLLKRSQEIEVGRVMALGNTDVVERASVPLLPVKPRVPLNLALGLLLGLGGGLGLALLLEQVDDTVRDEEDVMRFTDAPVLGIVPMFPREEALAKSLVDVPHGRSLEAYRALRYSLSFVTSGEGGRIVLVTSAQPQEGKTTTAANLATAVALSGRKAILVDADLRRPTLRQFFSLNGNKGLTDMLVGQAQLTETLQAVQDSGLRLICSGSRAPNPTDLLDSAGMREVVARLRREADVIIFDSPPLLSAADGLVLAGLSDAVLLVCVPSASRRRALQRAGLLLSQVGRRVSGVVLNKVERKTGYGSYYGYYADPEAGAARSRRRKEPALAEKTVRL